MRRIFVPLMLCAAFALVLSACSKSDTNSNSSTTSNASNTTTTATTTTSTPAKTTTTSSGEKIGVAECDDFLDKYEACVSGKVPEAARVQYQASLKQWRDSWRQLAANPQTKGSLGAACKMAAEQAKQAMTSYGCSF